MKVRQLMNKKVVSVNPSTSFRELWKIIFKKKINGLPVVTRGKLVGVVSEQDLLSKLYPSYEDYITDFVHARKFEDMEENIGEITKLKAKDVMNRNIYLTYPEQPIMKALSKMILRKIHQLPVIEQGTGNKLVGIITRGDIFNALYKKIPRPYKG